MLFDFVLPFDQPFGELDMLRAIGPIAYIKEKLSNAGDRIEQMMSTNEDKDEGLNGKLLDFLNEHMLRFQEIIAETASRLDAAQYEDQQQYLDDVFDLSAEKSWRYMSDILKDPETDRIIRENLDEEMVKDTVMLAASALFICTAVENLEEEEEGDIV